MLDIILLFYPVWGIPLVAAIICFTAAFIKDIKHKIKFKNEIAETKKLVSERKEFLNKEALK